MRRPARRARPAALVLALAALALLAASLAGCAALPRQKWEGRVPLTAGTLHLLEGTYAGVGAYAPAGPDGDAPARTYTPRLLPMLAEFGRRAEGLAPLPRDPRLRYYALHDSAITVTLRVRDPGHLLVTATRDGATVDERVIAGGVDAEGYFAFDGRDRLIGYPPLLWGPASRRGRLGVDGRGALLVETAYRAVPLVLIFPFGDWTLPESAAFPRAPGR